jgi:ribonuclease HI
MADKARMLERLAARLDLTEPERAALHEAAAYFRSTQSDSASGERAVSSRPVSSSDGSSAPDAILWSDGAARGNPGPAGAGAVLKKPSGEVLAEVSGFLGHTTNNVAEYKALLMGLERALALGIRRIEVRADSELLIKQLRGEYRVKDEKLKLLFAEAKALLARFASSKLLHVRREQNAEADRLANAGIDSR